MLYKTGYQKSDTITTSNVVLNRATDGGQTITNPAYRDVLNFTMDLNFIKNAPAFYLNAKITQNWVLSTVTSAGSGAKMYVTAIFYYIDENNNKIELTDWIYVVNGVRFVGENERTMEYNLSATNMKRIQKSTLEYYNYILPVRIAFLLTKSGDYSTMTVKQQNKVFNCIVQVNKNTVDDTE